MPKVVVMGSCLTNMACIYLMSDYKWVRPNNAAVMRSDYFVEKFINGVGFVPPEEEMLRLMKWKEGFEKDGPRWLVECYRDKVGHVDIPLEQPGLFATLESEHIDVILMDNLHDTHTVLLNRRSDSGAPLYSMPLSLSRCENERELAEIFYYGEPLTGAASAANWRRIVEFAKKKQPQAQIIFYCAHACTSKDLPDRYARTMEFYQAFSPQACELGLTLIPPLDLPAEFLRLPDDRDHFEWPVYRAMAGQIFLSHALYGR